MASRSDHEKRNTITERNNSVLKGGLIDDVDFRYIKDNHASSFTN